MSTYTYSYAYTRSQALVDQVGALFGAAGIGQDSIDKVRHGVNQKWLDAIGLYLTRDGMRVHEVEARINWSAHAGTASLDFSIDLPGWDGTVSPEAAIVGARFAARAGAEGLTPSYWVRFTSAVRRDPDLHRRLCPQVGVVFGSSVAGWAKTPTEKALKLQDLGEVGLAERSAL